MQLNVTVPKYIYQHSLHPGLPFPQRVSSSSFQSSAPLQTMATPVTPKFEGHRIWPLIASLLLMPAQAMPQQPVLTPPSAQSSTKNPLKEKNEQLLVTLKFEEVTPKRILKALNIGQYFDKQGNVDLDLYLMSHRTPPIIKDLAYLQLTNIQNFARYLPKKIQKLSPAEQAPYHYSIYLVALREEEDPATLQDYKIIFSLDPSTKTLKLYRASGDFLRNHLCSDEITRIDEKKLQAVVRRYQTDPNNLSAADQKHYQDAAQITQATIQAILPILQDKNKPCSYQMVIPVPRSEKGKLMICPISVYSTYGKTYLISRAAVPYDDFMQEVTDNNRIGFGKYLKTTTTACY